MRRMCAVGLLLSASVAWGQQSQGALPSDPSAIRNPDTPNVQVPPLVSPAPEPGTTPITREAAERLALKDNPRIRASRLLALAQGQVTRETRSATLPQVNGYITAEQAEDGSRFASGPLTLTDSRLYTHVGGQVGVTQLITDFGHTRDLVASSRLQQKAQNQAALATEQDVLFATDQAFYRLLNAESLLDVANAAVKSRSAVQSLTQSLTASSLKSTLDLNIASADLSQGQLLQLDAQNAVEAASASLAEVLAMAPETPYRAVEEITPAPPAPPAPDSSAAINADAQTTRPDLRALNLSASSEASLARAQALQALPSIQALGSAGDVPTGPDGIFVPHWNGAAAVNLSVPLFTGFRISAQAEEARLREQSTRQQARELSDAIARDVRVAVLNAETAFRRIAVADQYRTQAAQALALAQTRYQLGLSNIVELSQAQLQSTQADVSAVNARYEYLLSLRGLDYARGTLAP